MGAKLGQARFPKFFEVNFHKEASVAGEVDLAERVDPTFPNDGKIQGEVLSLCCRR